MVQKSSEICFPRLIFYRSSHLLCVCSLSCLLSRTSIHRTIPLYHTMYCVSHSLHSVGGWLVAASLVWSDLLLTPHRSHGRTHRPRVMVDWPSSHQAPQTKHRLSLGRPGFIGRFIKKSVHSILMQLLLTGLSQKELHSPLQY
jgi:hypothetical protein